MSVNYVITSVFLLILLSVVLYKSYTRLRSVSARKNAYHLTITVFVYILFDLFWHKSFSSEYFNRKAFAVVNFFFYLDYITLPLIWFYFTQSFIGKIRNKAVQIVLILPFLMNVILMLLNLCGLNLVWEIKDGPEKYLRGPLFPLFASINLIYYFIPVVEIVLKLIKEKQDLKNKLYILCFSVIPAAGVMVYTYLIPDSAVYPFLPFCFCLGNLVAFFFLIDQREGERLSVISEVSDDYEAVFSYNFDTNQEEYYKVTDFFLKRIKIWTSNSDFNQKILILSNLIFPDDRDDFLEGSKKDFLIHKVNTNKSYIKKYRFFIDSQLFWFEFRLSKCREHSKQNEMLVALRDITEESKKDAVYRNAIYADAIAYYEVNLTKDLITSGMYEKENNVFVETSSRMPFKKPIHYTQLLSLNAETLTIDSIQNSYLPAREELLLRYENGESIYEIPFKSFSTKGKAVFGKQTFIMAKDEQTKDVLCLAVIKEMNSAEIQKIEQEKWNAWFISTLTGLSDDFDYICYINGNENKITTFRIVSEFAKIFDSFEKSLPENIKFDLFMKKVIPPEDFDDFRKAVEREYILNELKIMMSYITEFKIVLNDKLIYYQLKVVADARNENCFILGLRNIDDEVKKKQEIQRHEKEMNAKIQMLATATQTVYPLVFVLNLTENKYTVIENESRLNVNIPDSGTIDMLTDAENDLIPDDDLRHCFEEMFNCQAELQAYYEGEKQILFRHTQLFADGEIHWVETRNIFVSYEPTVVYAISLVKCIDEEIARTEELTKAKALAESANNAKSIFLFNMSHDIRTPMNAISGYTSMAKKHIDDTPRVKDCLDKIDISGQHLLKLINQVLDMSRIESGNIQLEQAPINIFDRLNSILTIAQESASEKDITLSKITENITTPNVYADESRFNQILMNIISNAIKYTPAHGKVTCTAYQKESTRDDYADFIFIVEDTGIGMAPDYIEHIFEAFSREQNSTISGIEGTGLGMAIVKRLLNLMNGTIDVESKQNVGTRITINLSFRINRKSSVVLNPEVEIEKNCLEGKRLLLVEDNQMNREITKELLEDYNVLVEEAEDGDVAIEKISVSEPYDYILMDIQMPRMNGYKTTEAIRSMNDTDKAGTPIIAMTANAFEEDRKAAFAAGMNAHLSKPIVLNQLIQTLCQFTKGNS